MANVEFDSKRPYTSLVALRTELFSIKGVAASTAGSFIQDLTTAIDGGWWLTYPADLRGLLGRINKWRETLVQQA